MDKTAKKDKVLIVLDYYFPYWTGLTVNAKLLADNLVKEGFKVRVVTTKHRNELVDSEVINGVEVNRSRVWFRFSRSMFSPGMILKLIKEVAETDKVIVFLPFAEVLWVAMLCHLYGKRFLLAHNGDIVLPPGILNRLIEWAYYKMTYLATIEAKGIVVNTDDYAHSSKLLEQFIDKCEVINTLAEKVPVDKLLLKSWNDNINPNGKSIIIGFAGRFVREKGFDILLRAIPQVVRVYPQSKFLFAGELQMPYENFLQDNKELVACVKNNLVTMGLLERKQMGSFYELCDVFVISSRTDCYPTTQIEALLAGVPVVVTNIPGARVPVIKTGMGLVVEKENPNELAKAIIAVVKRKRNYLKPKAVSNYFSHKDALQKYLNLINGL